MNDDFQSPYVNADPNSWQKITEQLVKQHPLTTDQIVSVCLKSWEAIFNSTIGGAIRIGEDVKLTPQMIGNFLHVLIAHHLSVVEPENWRKEATPEDKDIVYIPNDFYSFEIKSSSSKNDIYGNRSYGQKSSNGKKSKDGFYLAVNFDNPVKFEDPKITQIKFGWLDHTDWIAQNAATGQQARLSQNAKKYKLIKLYP